MKNSKFEIRSTKQNQKSKCKNQISKIKMTMQNPK